MPALKTIIEANALFPPDMLDAMSADYLAGSADELWLITASDPLGFVYCAPERMTEATWNMLLIAVHPRHQGTGIGTALTRETEDAVAKRGGRVLLVETSGLASFAATRAFYAARGYAEEARIRDFYAEGEDKIVFWKALRGRVAD